MMHLFEVFLVLATLAVLNYTTCFEAAAVELEACGSRCGSTKESLSRNRKLANMIENNDQREAFYILDEMCK